MNGKSKNLNVIKIKSFGGVWFSPVCLPHISQPAVKTFLLRECWISVHPPQGHDPPQGQRVRDRINENFIFPLVSCSLQCIAASWSRESFPCHGRGWNQMGFKVPSHPQQPGMVWLHPAVLMVPLFIQEMELILSSQLFLAALALISAIPSKVSVSNLYFEKLKRGRC